MNRREARRALALAGVLALLALVLRLTPVKAPRAPTPVEPGMAGPPSPAAWLEPSADGSLYAAIVDGNVFSPDRTAPPLPSAGTLGAGAAGAPAARPGQRFRLSGLVRGPDGWVALIDADPDLPGAELYQVGDSVGTYLLEQATDSLVVLRRGARTQILRLDTISGRIP
ncbi:MAG: hypothetical protein JSU98_11970 [Gemmatimonadales bacterium]|nr:MAG: hypothetical protein JSU98_11970 [Gemmatimonadales bacterium]